MPTDPHGCCLPCFWPCPAVLACRLLSVAAAAIAGLPSTSDQAVRLAELPGPILDLLHAAAGAVDASASGSGTAGSSRGSNNNGSGSSEQWPHSMGPDGIEALAQLATRCAFCQMHCW